ncbi:MAG: twin-arginine translocation signal domain-containing protein, partial [Methanosarcinales archaeon]
MLYKNIGIMEFVATKQISRRNFLKGSTALSFGFFMSNMPI